MNDRARWPLILPLVGVVMVAWILLRGGFFGNGETISWNELKALVEAGEIEEVVLASDVVRAQKKATGEEPGPVVSAVRVAEDEGFVGLLDEHGVAYSAQRRGGCTEPAMLLLMLPMIAVTLLLFAIARRDPNGSGAAAFARSSAKLVPEEGTGVTFADVAGVGRGRRGAAGGRRLPADARASSRRSGGGRRRACCSSARPAPARRCSRGRWPARPGCRSSASPAAAFVEMFVGVGAARVRDLFKTASSTRRASSSSTSSTPSARRAGPGSGRQRGARADAQPAPRRDGRLRQPQGHHRDGGHQPPEILDPALLRPAGSTGRCWSIAPTARPRRHPRGPRPQAQARRRTSTSSEIAQLTPGFAGADLANVLNEAALLAARGNHLPSSGQDVEGRHRARVAGLEKKNRRLSSARRRPSPTTSAATRSARRLEPGADPVQKISIIPRGIGALWATRSRCRSKTAT
jgi:cell division protease FtsH